MKKLALLTIVFFSLIVLGLVGYSSYIEYLLNTRITHHKKKGHSKCVFSIKMYISETNEYSTIS